MISLFSLASITNYILTSFDILYVVNKTIFLYIYIPVILEYSQIVLMLFGVTWACNMSSHFDSENLKNTSEGF